jgi:myxalamid-type polyketide synthase MxaE and MxaD
VTSAASNAGGAPVAIVGIGCRFPGGVDGPASFWRLLEGGVDAITEIPPDRFDLAHYFAAEPATPGRIMTRWGGFLSDIDRFDADFFGISPREAERLDPQQRLLLETAWEAFEDAGQDLRRLEGSPTGVFVGQWLSDFEGRLFADPEGVDFFMTTGSGRYAASGRISYALGLRGPSLTLDTACSSSLAAVHLAVRSVRSGESALALAGGVNVILQPHISIAYSQSRMMAVDGRCKFGDANGDGYVRSEGAGLVVLKPLDRALADGDRIYAVIRGSAINNDGRSSGSMGTPSRLGQEELLRSAYRDAGVPPARVGYVEAHGTGTRAGDPVELAALGAVLGEGRATGDKALVGSAKTNIGHTEGAAGVAGLIKAALALHHRTIPASLHCRELNPVIRWPELPLAIARQRQQWSSADAAPRVAGVSAFGIAGSNAHVVLEEAPASNAASLAPSRRGIALLPLSAKGPSALRALAERYALWLEDDRAESLADICWSAATRRTALAHRATFVAVDANAMAATLRQFAGNEAAVGRPVQAATPKIAFIVPGQGAQWIGMARELLEREPVFRAALQRCDAAARPYNDFSILKQLSAAPDAPECALDRIDVIQPVLVAIAIAYAELWRSLGIEPDAVVGHSMGEVGAACIAGVLDHDQAMRIISRRSALMRGTSGRGAMALVELSMEEAQARLRVHEGRVSVAVSNSPRSSVISGDPQAVNEVMSALERDGVFCRLVKVDVASHSPQMEPLAAVLERELQALRPQAGQRPIYSTVHGRRAEPREFDAAYWARNLRQPVMFSQTVGQLIEDGVTIFVELGPHPVLLPSIEQTAQAKGVAVTTIECGRREEPEHAAFLAALGSLWAAGVAVDWPLVMPSGGRTLTLPPYPWQRERHWAAAAEGDGARTPRGHGRRRSTRRHPLLADGIELGGTPVGRFWEPDLHVARAPFLGDHRLHGASILAASAYVEMALAAAGETSADGEAIIESLTFEQPLYLDRRAPPRLQLRALPDGSALALTWHSFGETGWTRLAGARIVATGDRAPDIAGVSAACERGDEGACNASDLYARLEAWGAAFGASLRAIRRAWLNRSDAHAELHPVEKSGGLPSGYTIAPAALDACFQLAVAAMSDDGLWIPAAIRRIQRTRGGGVPCAARLRQCDSADGAQRMVDITLVGTDGPLLVLEGVELRRLGTGIPHDPSRWLFDLSWMKSERGVRQRAADRAWLLIADASGIAAMLAPSLEADGATVTIVPPDVPAEAIDLAPLLDRVLPARHVEVVYLRGIDADAPEHASQSLFGLVRVVQQLAMFDRTARRCTVVTRGAQAVGDGAQIAVAQASHWGLAAALSEEHAALWGACIDLDRNADALRAVSWLRDELCAANRGNAAQRGTQRFVPQLQRLQLAASRSLLLLSDATYLVTGGLGGVGLQVARWLVERGARRIAIVGRTSLPPRSQWSSLPAGSREEQAASAIRIIEALGASVHYAAIDVGDAVALGRFLDSYASEGWPPIRGVVHAAGAIDDCLVAELTRRSLDAVLRAKSFGAWHLDRLLPQLDLFVLFSSVAATLAQPGQASYAAANAFLGALARERRRRGQPALCVDWGVWQGVGLAATHGGAETCERLSRLGIEPFPAASGLRALGLLLEHDVTHAGVWPLDAAALRRAIDAGSLSSPAAALLAPLAAQPDAPVDHAVVDNANSLLDQLRARPREQACLMLEDRLAQLAANVLRVATTRLGRRTPLGSYGLNSLMALELRNCIEVDLRLPLSATVLWNYPTLAALAEHLLSRLAPVGATDNGVPSLAEDVRSATIGQSVDAIASLSEATALAALTGSRDARKRAP